MPDYLPVSSSFFGVPVAIGVKIVVDQVDIELDKQAMEKEAKENAWRTNPDTIDLVEPVTNILTIFEEKDEDQLWENIYLPEGSVCDREGFMDLFTKDADYSGMWGKHFELKRLTYDTSSDDGKRRRFYVDLYGAGTDNQKSETSISMIWGKDGSEWKLYPDSCFVRDNKYMLPATGDFLIDDQVIPTSCIVDEDYDSNAYVIYQIPVMLRKKHVVSYDTVFGNLKKKIDYTECTITGYEDKPLFANDKLTKKQEKIVKEIEKFCSHLDKVAYGKEKISALYPYLTSDYDKKLLKEQVNCYKKAIKEDKSKYANDKTSVQLYRMFPASKDEMCVIFAYYANDRYDTWHSHQTQGKLKVTMKKDKILITSFYDNGMFEFDDTNHVWDLPW